MRNVFSRFALGLALGVGLVWSAQAADSLQARDFDGDGIVDGYYDVAQDITWLANPNASGWRRWDDGVAWVKKLKVAGIKGWRLPKFRDLGDPGCQTSYWKTDCGYNLNPRSSELAHLYFKTLGNTSHFDRNGQYDPKGGLQNKGVFTTLDDVVVYAGSRFPADNTRVWQFGLTDGSQSPTDLGPGGGNSFFFWPVHDGDVGSPI